MGGEEEELLLILNLGTRWWVVSVTSRPRFTPGERTPPPPRSYWIGGWVGPTAGLDEESRRKILFPCRGLNLDHPARSQTLYCLSHILLQTKDISTLELRQLATKYCSWQIMFAEWTVHASLSATPPSTLIRFYF
jgi:hypothetical protein